MENIYEPNDEFPFSQLQFVSPTAIAGGNYFIRCLTGKQVPLYIQPPKCYSKSGMIKTGKRMYTDLVFKHDDEHFIEWVEKLENLCQTKIFDNREKWFESGLEMHDIENSFTPSMKIYKSGKMYVMRANIPMRLGKCGLKIYDEQENDVDPETINDSQPLMTILEIQGIKCSSRSFQLEVEIKQMMTLSPSDLFESCVFSKPISIKSKALVNPHLVSVETVEDDHSGLPVAHDEKVESIELVNNVLPEPLDNDNHTDAKPSILVTEKIQSKSESKDLGLDLDLYDELQEGKKTPIKEANNDIILNGVNLEEQNSEIDFPLDKSSDEVVQLKPRNDVYFEMYQNAKRKAKIARDIALSAYLEAKQIKNTYLIHENVEDDDDDEKNEEELKNIENSIQSSV